MGPLWSTALLADNTVVALPRFFEVAEIVGIVQSHDEKARDQSVPRLTLPLSGMSLRSFPRLLYHIRDNYQLGVTEGGPYPPPGGKVKGSDHSQRTYLTFRSSGVVGFRLERDYPKMGVGQKMVHKMTLGKWNQLD